MANWNRMPREINMIIEKMTSESGLDSRREHAIFQTPLRLSSLEFEKDNTTGIFSVRMTQKGGNNIMKMNMSDDVLTINVYDDTRTILDRREARRESRRIAERCCYFDGFPDCQVHSYRRIKCKMMYAGVNDIGKWLNRIDTQRVYSNDESCVIDDRHSMEMVMKCDSVDMGIENGITNELLMSFKGRWLELGPSQVTANGINRFMKGAFGEVWKGCLNAPSIGVVGAMVAVKTAKLESMNKEQIKEIMHEARLMRNLDHPNVVKFYGVAAGQEPLYVIMELADGGALDSALQKSGFPMSKKMELIYQASCGISYIHDNNLLHRDIAARNCLYGGGQVKISDFGLSREGKEYKMDLKKKVPIRWLPPETIRKGLYTQKVDVFAFGIMAWEITEDGKEPYPGMKVVEVVGKVLGGYRMPFSSSVDRSFADYVTNLIWAENPDYRPLMKEVQQHMKKNCGVGGGPAIGKSIMKKAKNTSIMKMFTKGGNGPQKPPKSSKSTVSN